MVNIQPWQSGVDHQILKTVLNKRNSVAWDRERTIPSDRRLSAKLVPTLEDRGVLRSQRGGYHTAVI
jgi:hypothetical protein